MCSYCTEVPPDIDSYAALLAPYLGHGFGYGELVSRGSRRFELPPRAMWPRMLRPLELAGEIREEMLTKHGAIGIRVNAAYRPTGGAGNSQHKHNRALDLDLFPVDYDKTRQWYEEAVRLWCKYGHDEKIGLGLYCPGNRCQGIRIHIDVGYRTRTWQHGAKVGEADAFIIARKLGLHAPGKPAPEPDESEDEDP